MPARLHAPTRIQFAPQTRRPRPCSCLVSSLPPLQPQRLPRFLHSSSQSPTLLPTTAPSRLPTQLPSQSPAMLPTSAPSTLPTQLPTSLPTTAPSTRPTQLPAQNPTLLSTTAPSTLPTWLPSQSPSMLPTSALSRFTYTDPTNFNNTHFGWTVSMEAITTSATLREMVSPCVTAGSLYNISLWYSTANFTVAVGLQVRNANTIWVQATPSGGITGICPAENASVTITGLNIPLTAGIKTGISATTPSSTSGSRLAYNNGINNDVRNITGPAGVMAEGPRLRLLSSPGRRL
jgi:hypothetical protein